MSAQVNARNRCLIFCSSFLTLLVGFFMRQSGPLWMSNLLISDPLYIAPFMYVGLQLLILRVREIEPTESFGHLLLVS